MKKTLTTVLLTSSFLLAGCGVETFDNSKLVVGLECDYAPFNWTTNVSSDFTMPINGIAGQYADGYDIQIAKALGDAMDKEVIIKKDRMGRFDSGFADWRYQHHYCRYELYGRT